MKVEIIGIYDRGNTQNERFHFRAKLPIDLKFYAVLDTQYQPDPKQVNAGNKNCYWFTPLSVKAGENIILYTRAGNHTTEPRPDGTVFHFFFRGLSQAIYTEPRKCAVLLEVNDWIASQLGK